MSHLRFIISALLCCTLCHIGSSQKPADYSAVDLFNQVEKLKVLGSVLYIAAHPDDENTRLISYFSNERKVRTAYLSLTRGDGGQNLIGTQIWEQLGLIRTNELLGARQVDGGIQYFSRANDFGYSKHPDETLAFWNKEEVMHDIIKVIREYKPDIIVNRFDHRTPGKTHGHHTASAMLSVEAFDLAGDKSGLADRLSHLSPWQPERVFFNTSWWFYGSRENFEKADKTNLFSADAGVYYPMRGISNNEIAARSRSNHKSQGFGAIGSRGSQIEYVELINGSRPTQKDDILSGLDLTWNRVAGGNMIEQQIDQLLANYNFTDPSTNIPSLIEIYHAVEKTSDNHWKEIKLKELKDIIISSAGIYLEATSKSPYSVRGDTVYIDIEAINRSTTNVQLEKVNFSGSSDPLVLNIDLLNNDKQNFESSINVTDDFALSNPYWLDKKGTMGMYHVDDESLIGYPTSQAACQATFEIIVDDLPMSITRDIVYKRRDPVDGEIYAPFYIMPKASVSFSDPIFLFPDSQEKNINVIVKSYQDNFKGVLSLNHPQSWKVSPEKMDIDISKNGEVKIYNFTIKGPTQSESATMSIKLISDDGSDLTKSVSEINYKHIPKQVILSEAIAKVERLDLKIKGSNIAYVQGAGDDIPISLRQIGYSVSEIEVDDISLSNLQNYDAVVMGIRVYNTKKELINKKDILHQYMNQGGTVIVQYNTSRRLDGNEIAPYPLALSRDRVTDELATVSFIHANHEVLNYPNKITSQDFEGWVQERGLYFPNKWDDKYIAPLACNDKSEPSRQGGLLIAEVGQGHFIYTGYSWFRQLPAGVPGAYRIFANMLSIGKNQQISTNLETGSND